ncbi:MAG: ornithine cyclodeaminase family protein [Acidimicrobiales bacterium]|nr:ornithine cyclodeaminase family protein [Acidimicrobiales bacterium]
MRFFTDADIGAALPWGPLIDSIEQIMVDPSATAPARTFHTVPDGNGNDAAFLLKPGWVAGKIIGVKAVTVFPDNGAQDLPMVQAGVLLFDGVTGSLVGACEANTLTTRRTAAASAVAAKRLARPDARRLLVVGTGALAPMAVQAHSHVRDYETIGVWGRNADKAAAVVDAVAAEGLTAEIVEDLEGAVVGADVISCVTGATAPLVRGALLQPGAHVDLIGGFSHEMREADDDVIRRASVFVDTYDDAALAGDIAQPMEAGLLRREGLLADLAELVAGTHPGRTSDEEVTMFKSAGTALEDLAAARLAAG